LLFCAEIQKCMRDMYAHLVTYHWFFYSLPHLFHMTKLVCSRSVSKNLVLLRDVRLKRVRVNMIGVNANVPCRLVWDLSPKTIKPTGMVGQLGFAQNLSLAGNQASPLCTLPYF
jgi:hypothetical protein